MKKDHLQQFIDVSSIDIDPELFAAAIAIYHISKLIVSGGSSIVRPDLEIRVVSPAVLGISCSSHLNGEKTNRFEQEWRSLQQAILSIKIAWENGQAHFQENLTRVLDNSEEMEYLSQVDFAEDCYAYVAALKTYLRDGALQVLYMNGYMLA